MTRDPEPLDPRSPRLRIAFVPGVTPDKWARLWRERVRVPLEIQPVADQDQLAVLRDDAADMCLVRLPVDTFGLSVIPLYSEVPVVVAEKEHPVSAYDEVAVEDLADEHLLQPPESVPEWRDIATEVRDGTRYEVPYLSPGELFESIGAGAGIAIVPMSVARLHNRKDVIYRPVTGVAESQIGLAWLTEATDPRIDYFIGIVRGRTARSSRTAEAVVPKPTTPKKAARPPAAKRGRPTRDSGRGRKRR